MGIAVLEVEIIRVYMGGSGMDRKDYVRVLGRGRGGYDFIWESSF